MARISELGKRIFGCRPKDPPLTPMDIDRASSLYIKGEMSLDEYNKRLDAHFPPEKKYRQALRRHKVF